MSLDGQFGNAPLGLGVGREAGVDSVDAVKRRIGQAIRRRRRIMNLTLEQVGSRCGFSFQQIQKYEAGVNTISAAQLWAIAQVLEVPVSYFFEGLVAGR